MLHLDFLNNIIHTKSNRIIKAYANELKENVLFNEKLHPWMRYDPLEKNNYQCDFNGVKVALSDLFWGTESIRKENIIIICGEKHIGKSFFAEKILKSCEKTVRDEKRNLVSANNSRAYRIPILIEMSLFERSERDKRLELGELILAALEEKCPSEININQTDRMVLKKDINSLLSYGRFVVYFQDNDWVKKGEDLAKILNYGKVFSDYNEQSKYHNIVLLTSDLEGKIKDTFLSEKNCGYITLEALTEDEVKIYLRKNLPDFLGIAEANADVMKLLCYPEHLMMFEQLCNNEMINSEMKTEDFQIKDKFALYDFYIKSHIESAIKQKEDVNKFRVDKIFMRLQTYTWQNYIKKGIASKYISKTISFSDFYKCGLLNEENDEFVFPYCGYYLIAKQLLEVIKKESREKLIGLFPDTVKEDGLEIIFSFASKMIDEQEMFAKFWHMLANDKRYPLLLLTKIVKESMFKDNFLNLLYAKAFDNFKREFYDYSVLEMFEELKPGCSGYLKANYLSLGEYNNKEKNNIKKRIVYYLGISHNGILKEMIAELLDKDTEQHLKYHIIRAAVENYDNDLESKKLIDENIDKLSEYCNSQSDPIIKSDFSILFEKSKNEKWQPETEKLAMQKKVEEKLEDNVYWVRAHAAGAIGRSKKNNTSELLLNRVKRELQNIYDLNPDYRNSIKVISYSIEALCELHNTQPEEPMIKALIKLIDVERMWNLDIEDAYSTIATGIEYMINSNKDKLAFNLGGRFRNHTSNYRRVLLYILEELFNYYESDEEMQEYVQNLCKDLNESEAGLETAKAKTKRIMHLSDWHLIKDSTENNLIMTQIKEYMPIDLLVITGDLRQIFNDYKNSLESLNKVKEFLGLELKNIFMVPGNHDSDNIDNQETIYADIRTHKDDRDYYNEYRDSLYTAFDTYKNFVKEFFGEEYCDHGGIHNKLFVWDNCLQILCLNTALMCDKKSEEKKITDILELSKIESSVDFPVIAMSHHPFDELQDMHREAVKSKLKELKVSVLLSGDKHISRNATIGGKHDGIPNLIIGKTYKDNSDNYSEHNIAIYELNLTSKKMIPYLKKWEKCNFVPSTEFSYQINQNEWKTMEIDLL